MKAKYYVGINQPKVYLPTKVGGNNNYFITNAANAPYPAILL